jgi:hypothetical protein
MAFDCEKLKSNMEFCNCTYAGCPRMGNCCACLQYHLNQKQLPACCFPEDAEKTWDRSFRKFIETWG